MQGLEFISRHNTGDASSSYSQYLATTEKLLSRRIEQVSEKPSQLLKAFNYALDRVYVRSVLTPEDIILQEIINEAAHFAAVYSKVVQPGDGSITLNLDRDGKSVEVQHAKEFFGPNDIAKGIYVAIISRDRESLTDLCRIDPRKYQNPNITISSYTYSWTEFLQALVTQSDQTTEKLSQAYAESEPEKVEVSVDYALYLSSGIMEVFANLNSPPEEFHDALARALQYHKKFYDEIELNPGETMREHPTGFISLGLLAACVLYHDQGYKIEVKSDYIPEALIDGRFVDESLLWRNTGAPMVSL